MTFSRCLEVTAYEGGADAGDRGPEGHDLGYGVERGHAASPEIDAAIALAGLAAGPWS